MLKIAVEDLSILGGVIDFVGRYGLFVDESLELVALGHLRLIEGEWTGNLVFVHNDSIVVDLSKTVCLPQVIPTDFVVEWNVITFAKTTDTHVDVVYSGIVVHVHDVDVVKKDVDDEDGELD